MHRILIVEDEVVIRTELRRMLARQGYVVSEAGSVAGAVSEHDLCAFDLVIADVRLPGAEGTELIAKCPNVPVLLMTSYATVKSAVESMKRGAVDYIAKPFDHDELLSLVESILAKTKAARALSAPANAPGAAPSAPSAPSTKAAPARAFDTGMIGSSEAMHGVFDRIRKVAPSDATVLVLGESGTGKELVARALHQQSGRREMPFVPVNCAAIPEGLIESELFGHERGAFTGATSTHAGLVEAADGGTLFLDEIGELPASAQARLLRFLQTGEVRHVGSTRARRVSARLVAATHRDLQAMVREGTFRNDLYFRLRVIEVRLPPLRERGDDALAIARHLLAERAAKQGAPALTLSPEAERCISTHEWPGNVRELENAIERAVVLCEGKGMITPELLGLEASEALSEAADDKERSPSLSLEQYFRTFVLEHQDHMTETEIAKRLGISRKALWERRHRLGLPRPRGG